MRTTSAIALEWGQLEAGIKTRQQDGTTLRRGVVRRHFRRSSNIPGLIHQMLVC